MLCGHCAGLSPHFPGSLADDLLLLLWLSIFRGKNERLAVDANLC
jgi:hypothetical protein